MNKENILKINEQCIFEELEKELFLLNIDNGQYYEVNEIGSKILKIISEKKVNFNELCNIVKKDFSSKNIERDIEKFLLQAIKKEIILL